MVLVAFAKGRLFSAKAAMPAFCTNTGSVSNGRRLYRLSVGTLDTTCGNWQPLCWNDAGESQNG